MQELFTAVENWIKDGRVIALATVIRTWGSSPRDVGDGHRLRGHETHRVTDGRWAQFLSDPHAGDHPSGL